MPDRLTWSSADVAAALGHGLGWFYQNVRRLRAAGFPPPLPVVRRYDPAAVRAWIVAQSSAHKCGDDVGDVWEPPGPDDDDAWGRVLDHRARRLGQPGKAA